MRKIKGFLLPLLAILFLGSVNFSCKKSKPVVPALPPANLIAHWPLDGNAQDVSRYHNNGIAFYTTPVADRFGKPNAALEFDGQKSYIGVPDSVRLRLAYSDFTLNAWVKMDSFNTSYASPIISKRTSGINSGWLWAVNGVGNEYLGPLGSIYYGPGGGGSVDAVSYNAIALKQWAMITCVYTALTQKLVIYINGVVDHEVSGVVTPNGAISTPLYIGYDLQGSYFLQGTLDDIRIYSTALTQADINNLYSATN